MIGRVALEEVVDMLDVVERIIEIESQFGCLAQLESHLLGKVVANRLRVFVDICHYLLPLVRWENTEICFGNAQIGLDTHCAH